MTVGDEERLVVALEARIAQFEKNLLKAERTATQSFNKIRASSKTATANMERDMIRSTARVNQAMATTSTRIGAFGAAFAGFASAAALAAMVRLNDAYIKIQNSLKVAGLSGRELNDVYDQLYASAQKNAAPIDALATLYSRVAINQKELGVSSKQVVGLVNSVAMSLKVQGTGALEAQGALLQLSQALGSSRVQAEEWGSLLDGMPVLLQAAAAGIQQAGGSVSKLTQLVKSGRLSNKALFDGIAAGSSVIEEKLAGSTETMGQSLGKLRNALINANGKLDEATGSSEKFSKAVGALATYLDTVKFDNFVLAINNVITALDTGIEKFTTFMEKAGKAGGITPDIAKGFADTSRQDDAISNFASGRTAERQAAEALTREAQRQLDIQKQIDALRKNPVGNQLMLRDLEAQRDAIKDAAKQSLANNTPVRKPVQGPLNYQGPIKPPVAEKPINIDEAKYRPVGAATSSGGKSAGTRMDEYDRETRQMRERTDAIEAETTAQAALNPLIDDFGFAAAKAAAKQQLLTAAKRDGVKITPELAKEIENLSDAYADATVANQQLADKQDMMRQKAENMVALQRDIASGFIDAFTSGQSAADAALESLKKIGDYLINDFLDSVFTVKNASGGGNIFGFLGNLFGGGSGGGGFNLGSGATAFTGSLPGYAKGGVANSPSIFAEAGPEAAVPLPDGRRIPVDLGNSAVSGMQVTYSPSYSFTGTAEEIEKIKAQAAQDRAEFAAKTVATIRDAQKRRII